MDSEEVQDSGTGEGEDALAVRHWGNGEALIERRADKVEKSWERPLQCTDPFWLMECRTAGRVILSAVSLGTNTKSTADWLCCDLHPHVKALFPCGMVVHVLCSHLSSLGNCRVSERWPSPSACSYSSANWWLEMRNLNENCYVLAKLPLTANMKMSPSKEGGVCQYKVSVVSV